MALSNCDNKTTSLQDKSDTGITKVIVSIDEREKSEPLRNSGSNEYASDENCNNAEDPGRDRENSCAGEADGSSDLNDGEYMGPISDLSVNQWIESIEKQVNELKETTEAITRLLVDDLETIKNERNKLSEEIEEIFHNITTRFGRTTEDSSKKNAVNPSADNDELTPDELQANAPKTEADYERIYEIIRNVLYRKKTQKQESGESSQATKGESGVTAGINVLTKSKSIPLATGELKNAEVFNKQNIQGDIMNHGESGFQNLPEGTKPLGPSASEGINEGGIIQPNLTNILKDTN